jgi:hypothetical protein
MVMLFGILFCLLGIVSIYIGLIYEEVKGRPNFVIRQTFGVDRAVAGSDSTEVVARRNSDNGVGTAEPGRLAIDRKPVDAPPSVSAAVVDSPSAVSGS